MVSQFFPFFYLVFQFYFYSIKYLNFLNFLFYFGVSTLFIFNQVSKLLNYFYFDVSTLFFVQSIVIFVQ